MEGKQIYKKISQIVRFTSLQWKGFFTADEKQEFIENYLYCYYGIKNGEIDNDNSLNTLLNLLNDDIYQSASYESDFTYTNISEVDAIINNYIYLIIENNLDFSKLD